MEIIIENNVRKNSRLYKAVLAISAEKYFEFYKKTVTDEIISKLDGLTIEIFSKNLYSEIGFRFNPQFKKAEREVKEFNTFSMAQSISRKLSATRIFDLYSCIPVEFPSPSAQDDEAKFTPIWQEFLSENLGKNLYTKLLAEKAGESIKMQMHSNERNYNSLVEKLNEIKRKEAELEKEWEEYQKQYSKVLDKKGNVLPIEESDFNKNV